MTDSTRAKGNRVSMKPDDGFHVEVQTDGEELGRLELQYRRGGELVKSMVLAYESAPVPGQEDEALEATAGLYRSQLLVEAVCRFFNTGGTFDEARRLCEGVMANILTVTAGQEVFPTIPEPWQLVDTEAGQFSHLFMNMETGNWVKWVEGQSVERVDPDGASSQDPGPQEDPEG